MSFDNAINDTGGKEFLESYPVRSELVEIASFVVIGFQLY